MSCAAYIGAPTTQHPRLLTRIGSNTGQGLLTWREDIDLSTFDKACPECEATNSAAAVHCACGYVFNPLYLEDPQLALEQAAREEQLIEEYLAARAEQAVEVAKEAVQAVLQDPQSERKLLMATRAQRAARAAKAGVVEQRARAAEARLRAHIADVDQLSDSNGVRSSAPNRSSWRTIVVTEALKAASLRETGSQLEGEASVTSREQPGPAFKAAQAAKAEKVVSATVRKLNLLPLQTKADEDPVFIEEAEMSGPIKRE